MKRVIGSIVLLALCVTLGVEACRRVDFADGFAFFGWAAHLHGVYASRRGVVVATSTVQFGREYEICLQYVSLDADSAARLDQELFSPIRSFTLPSPEIRLEELFGFGVVRRTGVTGFTGETQIARAAVIPYWFAIPAAGLPGILLARRAIILWRRRRRGQCVQCGYDLRGGHARCPECGAVTSAVTPAAAAGSQA